MKVGRYSAIALLFTVMIFPSLVVGKGRADLDRSPYIIFSDEPTLKDAFGVRHRFPGMFTSDLSPGEVRMLNRFGIKTEQVKLYHLSKPPGACDPWPDCKNGVGTTPPARIYFPDDQTPWGIKDVYGDAGITATSGGGGVNVAVLDTGVFKDHLDLVRRVAQCVDFTAGGPFKVRIKVGNCSDGVGHGTHVAGTILADGGSDGLGIFGVAPGATLLAYKVCTSSGCWSDDIAAAIDYAGSHGANIVSMSLGGDSESTLIRDVITRNTSILYVAAAGNDGPNAGSIDYPAANPNVIAVGAMDLNFNVPDWSSRGINNGDCLITAREVEFGAPGVNIESTWNDGSYIYLDGTSMATPHISGLAAKLWQGNASATRSYLQNSAQDVWDSGDDTATGLGLPRVVSPSAVACSN